MIRTDDNHLLMVEPDGPPTPAPVVDEFTRAAAALLRSARLPEGGYRGVHQCTGLGCTATSDNHDHFVTPLGVAPEATSPWDMEPRRGEVTTNSLIVHYVAHHRADLEQRDLDRVLELAGGRAAEPSDEELTGRGRRGRRGRR